MFSLKLFKITVLINLFLFTNLAITQNKLQIGKEKKIIESFYSETDITASINPLDSSNIVVTFLQHILNNDTNSFNAPIYYTSNSGIDWRRALFTFFPREEYRTILSANPPLVRFDGNGMCYLVWNMDLLKRMPTEPDSIINTTIISSSPNGKDWSENTQITRSSWGLNSTEIFRGKSEQIKNMNLFEFNDDVILSYLIDDTKRNNSLCFTNINIFNNRVVDSTSYKEFTLIDNFDFQVFESKLYGVFEGIKEDKQGIFLVQYSENDTSISYISQSRFLGGQNALSEEILLIEGLNLSYFSLNPKISFGDQIAVAWTATGIEEQTEIHKVYIAKSNYNNIQFTSPIKIIENKQLSEFNIELQNYGNKLFFSFYATSQTLLDTSQILIDYNLKSIEEPLINLYSETTELKSTTLRNFNYGIGSKNEIIIANDQVYIFGVDGRSTNGNLDIYLNQLPLNIFDYDYSRSEDLEIKKALYRSGNLELEVISNFSTNVSIRIVNNNGKIIKYLENYNFLVGLNSLEINLNYLSRGAYFLQIVSKESKITYPFII